jgi:micrococcal nuclease
MEKDNSRKLLGLSGAVILVSIILLLWPARRRDAGGGFDVGSSGSATSSKYVVREIIDGDTFVLSDGTQIRLIGIDAPEEGQPFYREAIDLGESLLAGTEVTLIPDRDPRDRYGRLLTYLFVDSLFYNEALIDSGLGSVYLFEKNTRFADRLIEAQKKARSSRRGIWSLPPPPPEKRYINPQGSLRFHRPLCWHLKGVDISKARRFSDRNEALDIGLSPCRTCRP